MEFSVVVDGTSANAPPVPRYPHLLLQVFPSAETPDVLLKRVIARDTAAGSQMKVEAGEGALSIPELRDNELDWLAGAKVLHASYAHGTFRGALAKVLGTEQIGQEIMRAVR